MSGKEGMITSMLPEMDNTIKTWMCILKGIGNYRYKCNLFGDTRFASHQH